MNQASASAARLADTLASHRNVARLHYPTRTDHPDYAVHARQMNAGSTLIAFSVKGARAEAFRVLNALRLMDRNRANRDGMIIGGLNVVNFISDAFDAVTVTVNKGQDFPSRGCCS